MKLIGMHINWRIFGSCTLPSCSGGSVWHCAEFQRWYRLRCT